MNNKVCLVSGFEIGDLKNAFWEQQELLIFSLNIRIIGLMHNLPDILINIRAKITDDSDLCWTRYDTAKELRDELDIYINRLNDGDMSCLDKLNMHFLPTSTFQEHSIQNGWSDEYIRLAEQFDEIYARIKS